MRKKHVKTSVSIVEKCPDIPVAVVQYTFTHKQHTEQHNGPERNIRNNKNYDQSDEIKHDEMDRICYTMAEMRNA
jgi:hypothetical protein